MIFPVKEAIKYFSTWLPVPDQVDGSTIVSHEQKCTEGDRDWGRSWIL